MVKNEEKKIPKSIRKFIRKEKARIRREVLYLKEQEKQISELYEKVFKNLQKKPKEIKSPIQKKGESLSFKKEKTVAKNI